MIVAIEDDNEFSKPQIQGVHQKGIQEDDILNEGQGVCWLDRTS